MEWSFWFDGEFSVVTGTIKADSLREAKREMRKRFPDDIGSDGELFNPITDDTNWPW